MAAVDAGRERVLDIIVSDTVDEICTRTQIYERDIESRRNAFKSGMRVVCRSRLRRQCLEFKFNLRTPAAFSATVSNVCTEMYHASITDNDWLAY